MKKSIIITFIIGILIMTLLIGCVNVSALNLRTILKNRRNSNALIQREINVGPVSYHFDGLLGRKRSVDLNPSNNVQNGGLRNVQINLLGANGKQKRGLLNTQVNAFGGKGIQEKGLISSGQWNVLGSYGDQRLNIGARVAQYNVLSAGRQHLNIDGVVNQHNILSLTSKNLNVGGASNMHHVTSIGTLSGNIGLVGQIYTMYGKEPLLMYDPRPDPPYDGHPKNLNSFLIYRHIGLGSGPSIIQ